MVNFDEIIDSDIQNGHFDIYVIDLDLSLEQIKPIAIADIARVSDINPYDVKDETVFEQIKKITAFLKTIADEMYAGSSYSVLDESLESYVKVILKRRAESFEYLKRVSGRKFLEYDIFPIILMRDVMVRYNKYLKDAGPMNQEEKDRVAFNFQIELEQTRELIESKRSNPNDFKSNISVKKVN